MKVFSQFIALFLFVNFLLINKIFATLAQIPHYEIYPPTPIVTYEEEILDFYSVKSPYGEFSNFALFPIEINGRTYQTSEHYYQSEKYLEVELKERVINASTPMEAALIGRDPKFPKREDWSAHKDIAMEIAVRAKFSQYKVLQELLISTNTAKIFEHTKNDCYWGDCLDRTGQNKLGLLLMKLRAEYSINVETNE